MSTLQLQKQYAYRIFCFKVINIEYFSSYDRLERAEKSPYSH